MPDPLLLAQAFAASTLTAAVVVLIFGWPWRASPGRRTSLGVVLGMSGAIAIACWLLTMRPHWPPREDRDRLLLVLLPALFAVETLAALGLRPSFVWPLRLLVAANAAPILLYGSVYVADVGGPGTRKWTPSQAALVFIELGVVLSTVWGLLTWLVRRTESRAVPLSVALSCLGTAAMVALSGYASAAGIGFALAAALAGSTLAALFLAPRPYLNSVVALGVVGLFALLVVGHFFGELALGHAVALLLAPLLCWLPELPYLNRLGTHWRGLARVALTSVPIALTLTLAYQQFVRDSARSAPDSRGEPSLQDYLDFGK